MFNLFLILAFAIPTGQPVSLPDIPEPTVSDGAAMIFDAPMVEDWVGAPDESAYTIAGCTDPSAMNFIGIIGVPVADDGSCYYYHCEGFGMCEPSDKDTANYWDFMGGGQ
jgi:hypothetical protein